MSWRTGGSRLIPLPSDWSQVIVPRILARDGYRCTVLLASGLRCGITQGLEVDHAGESWDHRDEMLRTLCHDHHAVRTGQQASAARWRVRERRTPERHPGAVDPPG